MIFRNQNLQLLYAKSFTNIRRLYNLEIDESEAVDSTRRRFAPREQQIRTRPQSPDLFIYNRKNKWNPCWVNNVIMAFRVGSTGPSRAKAVKSRFIIRLIVRRVRERNRKWPRCLCWLHKACFSFSFFVFAVVVFFYKSFLCAEAPKGAGGETVARVSKVARF